MAEYTDPAKELWNMFSLLQSASGASTADALASAFGCSPHEGVFHTMLAAVTTRCDQFTSLTLYDEELGEDRAQVLEAVGSLRQIFAYQCLPITWSQIRNAHFQSQYLPVLKMAGIAIRKKHQLRVIAAEERKEMIDRIDEALAAADEEGVGGSLLVNALRGLRVVLERFEFFGHDALLERLVMTHAATKPADVKAATKTRHIVRNVIMGLAAMIFIDDATNAPMSLYNKAATVIEYIQADTTEEIKLLTPPRLMLTGPEADGDAVDERIEGTKVVAGEVVA